MKRLLIAVFCLAPVFPLGAQVTREASPAEQPRPQGYTFFGGTNTVGDFDKLLTVGAGGEGFVYRGLAVGGEVGYLFSAQELGRGLGLTSADASYHFHGIDHNGRWIPFITGGYSLIFRGGAASLVNYGGGVTYWFRPHLGVRFEVRNHQDSAASLVPFRVGLSFR